MIHTIQYETQRLRVVPLAEEHIEELRVLRNRSRHCFYVTDEISCEQQKIWFSQYKEKPTEWMFAAYLKDQPERGPVGFAGIMLTDGEKRIADCGRMLVDGTKTTERGIGRELYASICRVAFDKCDVQTMVSYMVPGNDRSAHMCRAIGCDVKPLDDGNSVVTLTKERLMQAVAPEVTYF